MCACVLSVLLISFLLFVWYCFCLFWGCFVLLLLLFGFFFLVCFGVLCWLVGRLFLLRKNESHTLCFC